MSEQLFNRIFNQNIYKFFSLFIFKPKSKKGLSIKVFFKIFPNLTMALLISLFLCSFS